MKSLTNRVFLLSRRWPHHAVHSGYDSLGHHIGRCLTAKPIPTTLLPDNIFWRLNYGMFGYDRTGVALELLAARHMALHRKCLYHVLYGDNCYNYLGYLDGWKGHRIVASFHHPPEKFSQMVQRKDRLRRLWAAIVVGRNQNHYFEGVLPEERVFFVPHPVDTAFFVPPDDFSLRECHLCLFVGSHLRDFDTLRTVIEDARFLAPELSFVIVAHPEDISRFDTILGNYVVYSNVSDIELLRLYKKATLLVQPLHDTTANNAVLEAMSCGLPVVVTDIGAIRDYTDESCAWHVPPHNAKALLEAILHLLNDPEKLRQMSLRARERALMFDWHVVVRQMHDVYVQILGFSST